MTDSQDLNVETRLRFQCKELVQFKISLWEYLFSHCFLYKFCIAHFSRFNVASKYECSLRKTQRRKGHFNQKQCLWFQSLMDLVELQFCVLFAIQFLCSDYDFKCHQSIYLCPSIRKCKSLFFIPRPLQTIFQILKKP